MKAEKKGIVIISAVIAIAVVTTIILIPLLRHNSVSGYMKEDIKNVDNISLISRCSEIGGKKNSVAGVKESVRLGANAVIVDLCFRKDGTPVITDNYSNADSAETVEELFKAMSEDKFRKIGIYLNLVQLSDISKLNTLAVSYNMLDRLFLIGIDSDRYDLISSDDTIIPILLDYTFGSDELASVKSGKFKRPDILEEKGASGLVLDNSQITPELVETLNDYGIIFLVDGVDGTAEMCKTILNGTGNIIVTDIKEARETLDKWTEKIQERYKKSVDKSIKELSKEAE